MIELIIWVLLAHYIADYPLQGSFLAQTKGQYFYSLLVHSFIYGLTIGLAFKLIGIDHYLIKGILVVLTHIVIDFKKATAKNKEKALTTYLYIDQLLHIVINTILILI